MLQASSDAGLPAAAAPSGFARALQEHAGFAPAGEPQASVAGLLQGCGMLWDVNDAGMVNLDDTTEVAGRWRTSEVNPNPDICQLV